MNILIIEENKIISNMLSSLLKKFCIRLDVACDGFQALCAMKKIGYYLVIVNAQIKETNGVFIAQKITQINSKTKVIVLCENQLNDLNKNRSLEHGFIIFESPINFSDVKDVVEKIHKDTFPPNKLSPTF